MTSRPIVRSGNGKHGTLPIHSIEAEENLLGALMYSTESLPDIMQYLEPDDFFEVKHREIYRAILALFARGDAVDNTTVCNALRAAGTLESYGGSSYITQLINSTETFTHASTYAQIVKRASRKRRLIDTMGSIVQTTYDGSTDWAELKKFVQERVDEATNDNDYGELMPIDIAANNALADFEVAYAEPCDVRGLRIGLEAADKTFAGFDPGWSMSFVMATNQGKTTLAVQMLQALVRQTHVMLVPTEMSQERVVKRIVTQMLDLPPNALRTGQTKQPTEVVNAMADVAGWQVEILESRRPTIEEIKLRARQYKRRLGSAFGAIIVDSASNVGTKQGGKIFDVTRTVMNELAALCSDLNILGILTWQANRESYEGGIGVTSGRGAAEIEHASDMIFTFVDPELGYMNGTKQPPPDWNPHPQRWRQVKMVCVKDRESGNTGWTHPHWFIPGKGFFAIDETKGR